MISHACEMPIRRFLLSDQSLRRCATLDRIPLACVCLANSRGDRSGWARADIGEGASSGTLSAGRRPISAAETPAHRSHPQPAHPDGTDRARQGNGFAVVPEPAGPAEFSAAAMMIGATAESVGVDSSRRSASPKELGVLESAVTPARRPEAGGECAARAGRADCVGALSPIWEDHAVYIHSSDDLPHPVMATRRGKRIPAVRCVGQCPGNGSPMELRQGIPMRAGARISSPSVSPSGARAAELRVRRWILSLSAASRCAGPPHRQTAQRSASSVHPDCRVVALPRDHRRHDNGVAAASVCFRAFRIENLRPLRMLARWPSWVGPQATTAMEFRIDLAPGCPRLADALDLVGIGKVATASRSGYMAFKTAGAGFAKERPPRAPVPDRPVARLRGIVVP